MGDTSGLDIVEGQDEGGRAETGRCKQHANTGKTSAKGLSDQKEYRGVSHSQRSQ